MNKTLANYLFRLRNESKHGIIFTDINNDDIFLNYDELYNDSIKKLNIMQIKGIKQADIVIFQLRDPREFITSFWACVLGGIIPAIVPITYDEEHKSSLIKILKDFKNPYLLISDDLLFLLNSLGMKDQLKETGIFDNIILMQDLNNGSDNGTIVDGKDDDLVFIQYSSGSTGIPKGIVINNINLISNIHAILKAIQVTSDDSVLSWMPLTHSLGLIGTHICPLVANVNQVIMSSQDFIKNPIVWLENLSQRKISITASPNFGFKYILNAYDESKIKDLNLSNLRLIFNGAEPINYELCNEFAKIMNENNLRKNVILPVYGMGEATLAISFATVGEELKIIGIKRDCIGIGRKIEYSSNDNEKENTYFVSLGYAVEDCSVRIVDDNDNILEGETIGHIQIKGKNVTSGYINDKIPIEKCFSKDKWFKTGDMGFLQNNNVVVTGRSKDIIFIGGKNYYLKDIENIVEEESSFRSHDIVAAAYYNKKDHVDNVIVFLKYKDNLDNFNLIAQNIKHSVMKKFHIGIANVIPIDYIPKTNSGKIERFQLIKNFEDGIYNSILEKIRNSNKSLEYDSDLTDTEKKIINICRSILGIDIGVNDNFISMGANSILMIKIQENIENYFPGKLTISDLYSYPTISKLSNFIDNNEKISHLYLKMPEQIFKSDNVEKDSTIVKCELDGNTLGKIAIIERHIKKDRDSILLSLYIYMLYEILDKANINIEAIIKNQDIINPIKIDFESIDDFNSLVDTIQFQCTRKLGIEYSINNLNNFKVIMDDLMINNLYYIKDQLSKEINMEDYYDLIVCMERYTDFITITFTFNKQKIKEEFIEFMVSSYIKVIDAISKKLSQNCNLN